MRENEDRMNGWLEQLTEIEKEDIEQPITIDSLKQSVSRLIQSAGTIKLTLLMPASVGRTETLSLIKT